MKIMEGRGGGVEIQNVHADLGHLTRLELVRAMGSSNGDREAVHACLLHEVVHLLGLGVVGDCEGMQIWVYTSGVSRGRGR